MQNAMVIWPSAHILVKFGKINLGIYPIEINFNYMMGNNRHFFQLQKQLFIETTQLQSLTLNIF